MVAPVVTGISPKEGPPGTRVTIRGENLGKKPQDLVSLSICGCDCLLSAEWKSPNKIIARSGPGKGRGDIIVTTMSGGKGTSTVQFRGYHETIGPLKESAVWVEEAPLQTLAWGLRSLSPTSYQVEDPLGLSVEGNEKKFPEDDLNELFPEGSGDLASDNFEPGWFLLEHHHGTSFDDLRVGLSYLRRKVEGQKEGQLSFLKANIGSVMEQLDTLFILKEKFEADVMERGLDPTIKMEKAIRDSMFEANKLFEGVLKRRERADATRNALGVLQRFRFLFTLPVTIERNIQRGEYDAVINDYARAQNLFGKTDVLVFRKVLNEVEQKINDLRVLLKNKLQDMPTPLHTQKKIIRNLVHLDFEGDPVWEAINVHYKYITEQLGKCKDKHLAAETAQEDSGKTPKSSRHSKTPSGNQVYDSQEAIPHRVQCVEQITEIMSVYLSDLWKLGQSYFCGELQVRPQPSRPQEFKKIVMSVIAMMCGYLRGAIIPNTLDKTSADRAMLVWSGHGHSVRADTLADWLPHCLRYVRAAYSLLITLDLPSEPLDTVGKLVFDLRLHCLTTALKHAADQVKALQSKESWKLEFKMNHGGTTELPHMFESLVTEAVTLVKETVVQPGPREEPLLDSQLVQKELSSLMQTILLNYVQVLEVLVNNMDDGEPSSAMSQLIGSPNQYRDHRRSGMVWEQRLLATLNNCRYTSSVVLVRLSELLSRHGYPPLTEPLSAAKLQLAALERRITETYLEHKSDPLVGTIEPSMYIGRWDWTTSHTPSDLRPYVKEIIANLIAVHAEVNRVCPELVGRVLSQITETVAEELFRLMSCVTKFSVRGNQQARIDIQALQRFLKPFTLQRARGYFEEALEALPPLKPDELKLVDEVLSMSESKMRLQLYCFQSASISEAS
ncbi:exocyst complex component 2 [Macrosteles quadrilineatus]|uniref:exocyst complex component 2 n=1 Tax=Macrosteles quadrilineatus TaxID=74068 RepID=UPI0023E0D3E1|nr:exocyst complex component 2 [Macrosteles quadrilineatus]